MNHECRTSLPGAHGALEVCGACYSIACSSVDSLRNKVEAQASKMLTYGQKLRADLEAARLKAAQLEAAHKIDTTALGTLLDAAKRASFDAYQKEAGRTGGSLDAGERSLMILALGVAGEAGEVADFVKKHVGHGHALDREKLRLELGDVLWYIAMLCDVLGLKLSDVADANIAKLRARYPEGFDPARSMNR